jgi:membrane protease YdiL (CAAX protease family)
MELVLMNYMDTILSNTLLNPWLLAVYGLVIFSLIGVWFIEKNIVWIITGVLALLLAIFVGHVKPIVLLPLILLIITAIASQYDHNRTRQRIWRLFVVILPLVIALVFSSAFSTWSLLDGIQLGDSSSSYEINVYMSKPIIALILLATIVPTIKSLDDINQMLKKTIPILVVGIPVVAAFSYFVGYTRFDFKLPMIIVVWGVINLFITCIGEEVFFRGIILKELKNSFASVKNGKYLALVLSSIIFGIVHFNGGILFILVATIAGLMYGMAYIKTEKVEASIIAHFCVNVFHFIFLTYPKI